MKKHPTTESSPEIVKRHSQRQVLRAIKFETAMSERQSVQFINNVARTIREQLLAGFDVKIESIGTLRIAPIGQLHKGRYHRANIDLLFIPRKTFIEAFDATYRKLSGPVGQVSDLIELIQARTPVIPGTSDDLEQHPIQRLVALWRQDLCLSTQVLVPGVGALTSRAGANAALKKQWAMSKDRTQPAPYFVEFDIAPSLQAHLLEILKQKRLASHAAVPADKGRFHAMATRHSSLIPPPPGPTE